MMSVKNLIDNWTLPTSMVIGYSVYALLQIPALSHVRIFVLWMLPYMLPTLMFVMLFFSYCKIDPKDFRPKMWHLWLLLVQTLEAFFFYGLYHIEAIRPYAEACLVLSIVPMAAAASVVTQKIGGNPASATTYTLISSTYAAVAIPLIFPLIAPEADIHFWSLFWAILKKIFPIIMLPLIVSLLLGWLTPKVKKAIAVRSKDWAYYIWAACIAVATGQITRAIVHSPENGWTIFGVFMSICLVEIFHFYVGKSIGSHYGDRVAAGQGLGQKNNIIGIWAANAFLNPLAAIGPGACILWQNLFNAWQIYRHNKQQE